MAKIPKFKSEQEEREFWDTHDFTDYLDDTEPVKSFTLTDELKKKIEEKKKKRHLTIRINQKEIDQAKLFAEEKGIGYQTLMRMWIIEGIRREQKAAK
jgi:predicted DNA binding CopG/RHH family protein